MRVPGAEGESERRVAPLVKAKLHLTRIAIAQHGYWYVLPFRRVKRRDGPFYFSPRITRRN
jgi:hypothetical protein